MSPIPPFAPSDITSCNKTQKVPLRTFQSFPRIAQEISLLGCFCELSLFESSLKSHLHVVRKWIEAGLHSLSIKKGSTRTRSRSPLEGISAHLWWRKQQWEACSYRIIKYLQTLCGRPPLQHPLRFTKVSGRSILLCGSFLLDEIWLCSISFSHPALWQTKNKKKVVKKLNLCINTWYETAN